MSPRKPPVKVEYTETWLCQSCGDDQPTRSRDDVVSHLVGFHCHPRPINSVRELATHMDFARDYLSVYRWTFHPAPLQTVVVLQYEHGPRGGRR